MTTNILDTKFNLTLHKHQHEVFTARSRFKVVVAGRRWGKTQLSKISIIRRAAGKSNQLVWYVAPTYRMAKQIMWQDLLDSIPKKWIKGKPNETFMIIKLINGSIIELKGADKPDTLRGVGLHYLVLDEFQDMKEDLWIKVLRPTLASTRGEALIIGTPKSYNLLYDVYQLGQNAKYRRERTWRSWQFPTITSPFIPEEEIESARADMDSKSFKQEFEASFETMSGRVYHEFDRHQNVKSCPYNPQLPLWIGQDFNIDPMSSILLQPQPDNSMWVVGEEILFGSNVQEVTQKLDQRFFKHDPKLITIYPDPAGNHRTHARGETSLDIFRETGFKRIKFRKKHPAIQDRINAVNRMLCAADGSRRLFIDKEAKGIIDSLEQTIYKKGTPEVDKSHGKEHAADALGYPIQLEFPIRKFRPVGVNF